VTRIRHQTFGWHSDKPPNSQLIGLRAVLIKMETAADRLHVQYWLDHLCKTDNRKDRWTEKALQMIRSCLNEPNFIWEMLAQSGLKELFPTLGAKANLENELWAEAVRTFFVVGIHYEQRERDA
jgi:hypothetical protein